MGQKMLKDNECPIVIWELKKNPPEKLLPIF